MTNAMTRPMTASTAVAASTHSQRGDFGSSGGGSPGPPGGYCRRTGRTGRSSRGRSRRASTPAIARSEAARRESDRSGRTGPGSHTPDRSIPDSRRSAVASGPARRGSPVAHHVRDVVNRSYPPHGCEGTCAGAQSGPVATVRIALAVAITTFRACDLGLLWVRWHSRFVASTAHRCRRTPPRSRTSSTTAAIRARCSGSCAGGGQVRPGTSNCPSRGR